MQTFVLVLLCNSSSSNMHATVLVGVPSEGGWACMVCCPSVLDLAATVQQLLNTEDPLTDNTNSSWHPGKVEYTSVSDTSCSCTYTWQPY